MLTRDRQTNSRASDQFGIAHSSGREQPHVEIGRCIWKTTFPSPGDRERGGAERWREAVFPPSPSDEWHRRTIWLTRGCEVAAQGRKSSCTSLDHSEVSANTRLLGPRPTRLRLRHGLRSGSVRHCGRIGIGAGRTSCKQDSKRKNITTRWTQQPSTRGCSNRTTTDQLVIAPRSTKHVLYSCTASQIDGEKWKGRMFGSSDTAHATAHANELRDQLLWHL